MYIAILGRQPKLGTSELEAVFGATAVSLVAADAALVDSPSFDIQSLGGTKKAGLIVAEVGGDPHAISAVVVKYLKSLGIEGKITLGISAYHLPNLNPRSVGKIGLVAKNQLNLAQKSVRLIPSQGLELSTAQSHHNKLGLAPNKVEILLVGSGKKVIVASSIGAQNITAYAERDQKRPRRDAFVGMLPPKLAQIIVNLATGGLVAGTDWSSRHRITVLDPFCGTGTVLQESLLLGFSTLGSDLSEKMVDYSRENLAWLGEKHKLPGSAKVDLGDATKYHWNKPISAVASEVYLGQPFSAIPSPAKMREVRQTVRGITTDFLKNLAPQIAPGTPICLAIPAWRTQVGWQHLDILDILPDLGYNLVEFKHARQSDLLYHRDNQVVARELLVLRRS